jgi:hypothetical protein
MPPNSLLRTPHCAAALRCPALSADAPCHSGPLPPARLPCADGADHRPAGSGAAAALASGRRRDAALALPVVQRADDDGPVDIVLDKLHQHFLADARQELAAHAAAGRALRHAHPAGGVAIVLPVVADAHAAQLVAIQFVRTRRLRRAIGADDDGALRAARGGLRMAAAIAAGSCGRQITSAATASKLLA